MLRSSHENDALETATVAADYCSIAQHDAEKARLAARMLFKASTLATQPGLLKVATCWQVWGCQKTALVSCRGPTASSLEPQRIDKYEGVPGDSRDVPLRPFLVDFRGFRGLGLRFRGLGFREASVIRSPFSGGHRFRLELPNPQRGALSFRCY